MSPLSVADDRRSTRSHRPQGRSVMACVLARVSAGVSACVGLGVAWLALAAPAQAAGIYSCVDATGKRYTSDRPIAECLDREQRVLNKDGSQRQTLPPRMNAEERALAEERQRLQDQAQAAQKDAVRRDRNLMLRLLDERQPMLAETEFYKGRRLPFKLKSKLEANDAQQQAQRDIIQNQNAETVRINALYDAELARLRRLWAGAAPGSVPPASDAPPARKR